MSKAGFVYFIRCEERVKIGFSIQPMNRLTKVNADAPFPCQLLGFVAVDSFTEEALHARFSAHRVHGEWFAASDEVLDFIAQNSLMSPLGTDRFERADVEDSSPLKRWRYNRKLNQSEAAALCGVGVPTWSRWESGHKSITSRRVLLVESVTGISRHDLRPDVFGPAPSLAEAS